VQIQTADKNSNFRTFPAINLNREGNVNILKFLGLVVGDVNPLNDKICNADSLGAKARYDQLATANKNKLHAEAPDNFRERISGRRIRSSIDSQ
jgi:hypothetical protein